ncbi:hypothetical protein RND71_022972 [Anisodus tanguticus]|uniref:mRNA capping enzyme C-terminal domain-containing protein n=1 Tax=Anisodus tanguticus TaxID=243964 RepID=A0AAE1RUN2_9SOLA|nr:hypothetical protein RND71_022972 [Anisodus tanguticus]
MNVESSFLITNIEVWRLAAHNLEMKNPFDMRKTCESPLEMRASLCSGCYSVKQRRLMFKTGLGRKSKLVLLTVVLAAPNVGHAKHKLRVILIETYRTKKLRAVNIVGVDPYRTKKLRAVSTVGQSSYGSDLSLYSGRIIECSWNSHEDAWIFVRIQTDKSNPDYISVYEELFQLLTEKTSYGQAKHNIEGNLTEDILLDEIDKVAALPIFSDWVKLHSGSFRNVWRRQ